MQKVEGKTIILTKGDTFKATVVMVGDNGDPYTPVTGDVVRFHMKKAYKDENLLIEKVIPNDTLLLKLDPADTKDLDVGQYVYDIEITYVNGDVDTFIDRGVVKLTEEVEGATPEPPTPPVIAGMTFESGEWTPTEYTEIANITFQNEHSEPPVFFAIIKKGEFPIVATADYDAFAVDWNRMFGHGEYINDNSTWYGFRIGAAANNNGSTVTNQSVVKFTATTGDDSYSKYVTSTKIKAVVSGTRYWAPDYTYEWFAAWMPET